MYKATILPLVKLDIREAAVWYNDKQTGLGKRFTAEVRQKVGAIKKNPFIFINRYDDTRTCVLGVFPFMIHYTINEADMEIVILAILHTSRNPDIWKREQDDSEL